MKFIISLLILGLSLSALAEDYVVSNEWGVQPLGAELAASPPEPAKIRRPIESFHRKLPADGGGLTLFENGEPQCVIILPLSASGSEKKAVDLLNQTLIKMTGKPLPVLSETKIQVEDGVVIDSKKQKWPWALWIGQTEQAAKQGISADDLILEGYRIRSVKNWLFLVGHDQKSMKIWGTVYAALAVLEDYLGVRWLWPGELGTIIPKRADVTLPALHEQNEPALRKRGIRVASGISDGNEVGIKLLGDTEIVRQTYLQSQEDQADWALLNRVGGSLRPSAGHSYGGWYERFGKEHPEWFALQPDGSRVQRSDRPRLCKSNPAVAHQKALDVIEMYKKSPDLDAVSIAPNDGSGLDSFCMCAECRKLDPPQGNPISLLFNRDGKRFYENYVSLSDRIATFYNRIAEEVAKTVPDAHLGAYAYSAYRDVPLQVTLHPSIIIGFVGLNYFDENLRQEDLSRWDGWTRRATQLFLRPNVTGPGDSLPAVFSARLGTDLRHMFQTGMMATDFDSLTGSWATQGLNYYVLARLLWDPSLEVDAIVKDYCDHGFGTASEKIQAYFHELEQATDQVAMRKVDTTRGELRSEEEDAATSRKKAEADAFTNAYFTVFTADFVQHLREILAQATQATEDESVRSRIDFLAKGLEYADLMRSTMGVEAKTEAAKQVYKPLLEWFRKSQLEQPQSLDAVYRLYRTSYFYRGIEK